MQAAGAGAIALFAPDMLKDQWWLIIVAVAVAVFSADTSFTRCTFVNTPAAFGLARVTRSRRDGDPLPDQWDGEDQADAAREAYAHRYARTAAAGRADDLPLDPAAAS